MYTIESQAPRSRVGRYPKHKFNLETRPFQIVPFMIAPILPAETITSAWLEAREVTDPIKNSLIGWSSEYYVFYVKIRDLDERDTLQEIFIDPTANLDGLDEAYSAAFYHAGGTPNFTKLCLKRVVETYFRDEGEAWDTYMIGDYPVGQYRDQGWMDSLADTTLVPAGAGDPGAATTPEALDRLMDAYNQLRAMSFTTMNFEQYCATFGIAISREQAHKPELVAKWSEWQYPSNTIDPTTGAASSAVSWVHKLSTKDAKLAKEPGFIFGVKIVRPKLYLGRQFGSMTHYLDNTFSWLPALMADSPETSLREFTGGDTGNGPLSNDAANVGPTNGYWVDMRDLFLYGDQMINYAPSTAGKNIVDLPLASLVRKYIDADDANSLFAAASPANKIRVDGFCSLSIKGRQVDFTGGHQAIA